jgi:CRISPR-associated protein Csa2
MKGFISMSLRSIVNVESLNGIESIGNLSRHRTAPIVVGEGDRYEIRFVPAISGEAIAHAFQVFLVEHANKRGLPVGVYSSREEFLKFTDNKILEKERVKAPQSIDDVRRSEIDIILKDIVCDVGGFLYAGDFPIKRTSRFQVGYMIPAQADVKASALEAQFHVRHASSELKKGTKGETRYQIPYNVEVGSAVYTLTFNMDIESISRPSTLYGKKSHNEKKLYAQRPERVKATLASLTDLVSTMSYGAKRSRFLPNMEPLSAVASFSPISMFTVSSGNSKEFIRDTVARSKDYLNAMKKLGISAVIDIAAFDKESSTKGVDVRLSSSLESLVDMIIERVLESET